MADSQSRSFWSFLILVDVLLLIAFGWALASRASHLLEEPAIGAPAYVKLPKAKPPLPSPPAAAAEPEGPAPVQAPAPEPAKTPEPAKAKAPEPAKAKAEPAPVKAKRVLFKYKDRKAKKVSIEGSFTKWAPKPMHRHDGEWRYAVYLLPGAEYPYRFVVDGKTITDPANPRQKWGKSLRPVD